MAILLFAAEVPSIFVRLRYAGKLYDWRRQRTPAERQAWYLTWLLTRDIHAKEIGLFELGPLFMHRYRDVRAQLRRERLHIMTKRSALELTTQAGAMLAVFGSYMFIAYRAVHGLITLGDLVMYYQAFQRAQGFLQETLGGLAGLYEDNSMGSTYASSPLPHCGATSARCSRTMPGTI
jgi:ATP-binding cassette, subfamily B, bacterial